MKKIYSWLDGKKTITGIVIGTIYSLAIYFQIAPSNDAIWTLIAAYTGIAYKLGINKTTQVVPTKDLPTDIPCSIPYIPQRGNANEPVETKAG